MAKRPTNKQRAAANAAKKSRSPTKNGKSQPDTKDFSRRDGFSEENGNASSKLDITVPEYLSPTSCAPKGLSNLGNTCFFNSVVQNLCRTPGLMYALRSSAKEKSFTLESDNYPNLHCELPPLLKLTHSFLNFLITMNGDGPQSNSNKQKGRARTESPRALFSEICSVSPRFRGYQQQDSQELLQALLDGLKTEEIRRRKQAILEKFGLRNKQTKNVEEDLKEKIKTYGQIATKMETVVDRIFCGKIVSSVLCDECGQITQVVEDFLDIPLPIADSVPMPHSNGSKKDSRKAPNADKNNEDSDKSGNKDSNSPRAQSKHSKKKQKQQSRKSRNRKSKTRGAENDGAVGNEKNDKALNGENDSLHETYQKDGNLTAQCKTDSADRPYEGSSMAQHDNESTLAGGENQGGDCSHLGSGKEENCQNFGKVCGGEEPAVGGDEQVSDLTSQLKELKLSNDQIKGTDFSTKRVQLEVTTNKEQECHKAACKIADMVLANAIEECEKMKRDQCEPHYLNNEDALLEKHAEKQENTELVNGEQSNEPPVQCSESDCGDRSEQSRPAKSTSPSSGNDEKEPSDNDFLKSNENCKGGSLFDTPAKKPEEKFKSFCCKLPTTISPRYDAKKQECSIESCLNKFTMAEMLTGNNKFGCEECTRKQAGGAKKPKTVYCNASKQLLIKKPPLILTLQLKRFQQSGRSLRKFSKKVEVPVEFDLSPFCMSDGNEDLTDKNGKILYRIYGVVEHSGSLSRGHYTAYVNARQENISILKVLGMEAKSDSQLNDYEGQWYHISDTSVSKCPVERAITCNAYLLFYERVF